MLAVVSCVGAWACGGADSDVAGGAGVGGVGAAAGSSGTDAGGSAAGGSAAGGSAAGGSAQGGATTGGSSQGGSTTGGSSSGGVGGSPIGGSGQGAAAGQGGAGGSGAQGGAGGQGGSGGGAVELLRRDGCFFTVAQPNDEMTMPFAEVGTEYRYFEIEFDFEWGGFRTDLMPPQNSLAHNYFGLSRKAAQSKDRYILGMAALIRTDMSNRTLFYKRNALVSGHMSYASFNHVTSWNDGATYHNKVRLDAVAKTQHLTITVGNNVFLETGGPIDYFDTSLTSSGWNAQVGGEDPPNNQRDVTPVGSKYCDLVIRGEAL